MTQETMQALADATGWPIVDGSLVIDPSQWSADDGNAEITGEYESGQEAADAYVADGDWGDRTETSWVTVRAWQMAIDLDGDECRVNEDSYTVAIEPIEPDCIDGEEHDWQSPLSIVGGCRENPGVYGHGGGVTIQEVCMRCGCGKLTDTWAQDDCGRQGLTSVKYESGKYANEIEAEEA